MGGREGGRDGGREGRGIEGGKEGERERNGGTEGERGRVTEGGSIILSLYLNTIPQELGGRAGIGPEYTLENPIFS